MAAFSLNLAPVANDGLFYAKPSRRLPRRLIGGIIGYDQLGYVGADMNRQSDFRDA
jgi:hypothetical protein